MRSEPPDKLPLHPVLFHTIRGHEVQRSGLVSLGPTLGVESGHLLAGQLNSHQEVQGCKLVSINTEQDPRVSRWDTEWLVELSR